MCSFAKHKWPVFRKRATIQTENKKSRASKEPETPPGKSNLIKKKTQTVLKPNLLFSLKASLFVSENVKWTQNNFSNFAMQLKA